MKPLTLKAAKKIATDHGLTLQYSRSGGGFWKLWKPDTKVGRTQYLYCDTKHVESHSVGNFYVHCMDVACNTATPQQMDKVILRERFRKAMDEYYSNPKHPDLLLQSFTLDKQVYAIEDGLHSLLEDLTEQHGTYLDHKQEFKIVIYFPSYDMAYKLYTMPTDVGPIPAMERVRHQAELGNLNIGSTTYPSPIPQMLARIDHDMKPFIKPASLLRLQDLVLAKQNYESAVRQFALVISPNKALTSYQVMELETCVAACARRNLVDEGSLRELMESLEIKP